MADVKLIQVNTLARTRQPVSIPSNSDKDLKYWKDLFNEEAPEHIRYIVGKR